MEQLARDGLCLLDHLGIDRAFVLGLSMGGMIAQELALLSPARIRALLLGCTHCGGRLRIPPSPDAIQVLLNNQGLSHEQIVEKNLPIFLSKACLRDRIEIAQAYQQAQLAVPLQPEQAFQAQLAAISAFDCSERVSEIKVPTLVVAGSEDLLIPQDNAHTLAQRIPRAELIVIPGAGHALHAECGEKLNTIAHDFFQRHTGD
jgi:pimeloyl-ACP methyl ester carboxylesterase